MSRFPGNLAPHFNAGDQNTPIDKFKVTLAGEEMPLRQAAQRLLHEPSLNFLEERKLLGIVKLIEEEKKFTRSDLETALESWGLSRGKSSMNYFLAIIDRMLEEKKRYKLQHRQHESRTNHTDESKVKLFDDDYEAEQFSDYLRAQEIPHRYGRDSQTLKSIIYADNVHELFKTYLNLNSRGDPRLPAQQPPDDATARLAMPNADASINLSSPSSTGEGEFVSPARGSGEECSSTSLLQERPLEEGAPSPENTKRAPHFNTGKENR